MEALGVSQATIVSLVVAIGFASGLNVYATVFSLGLMARLHWVALPVGLDSLMCTWVIAASGVLSAADFVADKIPGLDLVWNALHTFVRIPVAALLAYAAGSQLSPEAHVLVTCLGGAFATLAHGTKTAMRVAVTPSPEPISNIGLSTTEDGVAVGLTYLAMHHPFAAGSVVAALSILSGFALWKAGVFVTSLWRRVFRAKRVYPNVVPAA